MENLKYQIRTCRPADIDDLMVLIEKHAEYEKAAYNATGKKEKLTAALFDDKAHLHCIVAEVNDQVIGYATYTFDFSTWDAGWFIYLDCLYIEEAYRSYGIGQVLIDKVKEIGKNRNCINMQWQTPDFNVRAIKFYNRIGGIGKNKVRFTLDLK